MLKKKYRLRKEKDYKKVFREGRKIRGNYGMLIALRSQSVEDNTKIGFVVGKKVGNAVTRNQHTRRLREITREYIKEHPSSLQGYKISYISHKYCEDFNLLKNELISQLRSLPKL